MKCTPFFAIRVYSEAISFNFVTEVGRPSRNSNIFLRGIANLEELFCHDCLLALKRGKIISLFDIEIITFPKPLDCMFPRRDELMAEFHLLVDRCSCPQVNKRAVN